MSGSTKEDDAAFKELVERDPECKKCFECGYPYPQWCSYTHGILTCLECSGKHRGLGTHLVCVRSSTMDGWSNWKPEKLRQMQIGGNRRAREFFEARGVPKTPLKARYEHPAAQLYRAMLEAEAQNLPFNEAAFRAVDFSTPTASPAGGGTPNDRFRGQGSPQSVQPRSSPSAASGESEWLTALSSGWSTVTTKAAAAATTAVTAVEKTATKVTSDEFKGKVAKNASEATTTVAEGASKAWGAVSWFATSVASTVKKTVAGEGDAPDDGLGSLTRNVPRSTEHFDHIEHQSERTPLSPGGGGEDGLRGLTSHLKRSENKYEGLGSDAPQGPPPPRAPPATATPINRGPTKTPVASPQVSAPPPAASAPTANASSAKKGDGWDDDW